MAQTNAIGPMLDYELGTFHVVRQVGPKLACGGYHTIIQTLASSRAVDRCVAGAGLLTHNILSKFADHLPLYRLCQLFGRENMELARATISDCVGQAGWLHADGPGRRALRLKV